MNAVRRLLVPCAFASAAMGAGGAAAQTAGEASPVEFDFGASLSAGYTDNVYATENDRVGDVVTTLSAWAEIWAETGAYEWSRGADLDLGRYSSESSEDYDDAVLRAEGRYDSGRTRSSSAAWIIRGNTSRARRQRRAT